MPFNIIVSHSVYTFCRIYTVTKIKKQSRFYRDFTGKYEIQYTEFQYNRLEYHSYSSNVMRGYNVLGILDSEGNLIYKNEKNIESYRHTLGNILTCRFQEKYELSVRSPNYILYERRPEINSLMLSFLNQEIPEKYKEVEFDLF